MAVAVAEVVLSVLVCRLKYELRYTGLVFGLCWSVAILREYYYSRSYSLVESAGCA